MGHRSCYCSLMVDKDDIIAELRGMHHNVPSKAQRNSGRYEGDDVERINSCYRRIRLTAQRHVDDDADAFGRRYVSVV